MDALDDAQAKVNKIRNELSLIRGDKPDKPAVNSPRDDWFFRSFFSFADIREYKPTLVINGVSVELSAEDQEFAVETATRILKNKLRVAETKLEMVRQDLAEAAMNYTTAPTWNPTTA